MTNQAASVEVWEDAETGWLRCAFGDISLSSVWPSSPGMMETPGPLMLVTDPLNQYSGALALFGVEVTFSNGVARTVARNGTWLHRLHPAHWRDGVVPVEWSPFITLGMWPD